MTTLVKLVSEYYIWLIGVCVLGILFYIGRAIAAHQEKRRAIFTLEKEAAASTRLRSIGVAFVLLILGGAIYFTVTYLEPNLDLETENEPTPTVLLQPTPTPTPGPPTVTPTPRPHELPAQRGRLRSLLLLHPNLLSCPIVPIPKPGLPILR